jgi:serine protease Do
MKSLVVFFNIILFTVIFISCSGTNQQIISKQVTSLKWEKDSRSEKEFREYFSNNLSELDNIEGIWSVGSVIIYGGFRQEEPNSAIVAIIKDTLSEERDFYEIILKGYNWIPNTITAYFDKSADVTHYISKQFSYDGSFSNYNFYMENKSILKATKNEVINGTQVYSELTYIKLHPKLEQNSVSTDEIETKKKSFGTGFLIEESGLVVTNYHVVSNSDELEVIFPAKNLKIKASVIIKDINNDLVLLRLENFKYSNHFGSEIPFSFSDVNLIKVGQEVFTLGFPFGDIMGKQSRLSTGEISSLYGMQDDPRLYQISNPMQPGNSGGPLFNNQGS